MNAHASIETILVLAAVAVAVASWIFAVVELLLSFALQRPVYGFGRIVLTESIAFAPPAVEPGRVYTTANARMKLTDSHELLFVPRSPRRLGQPYWVPVKGRIRWTGAGAELEARALLGPSLFCGGWLSLVLMFAGAAMVKHRSSEALVGGLALSVLSSTGVLGFIAFLRSGAIESARRIVEEIAAEIAAVNPDTAAKPPASVSPPSSTSPSAPLRPARS